MAFKLKLTLIIDAFSYSSKPIICEHPIVPLHIFENFKRGIRVVFESKAHEELGLSRSHEGIDANEGYTLQIRTTSESDLRQIISDIRTGIAALNSSDEFYPWINTPLEDLIQGDGVWLSEVTIAARRVGKVRG